MEETTTKATTKAKTETTSKKKVATKLKGSKIMICGLANSTKSSALKDLKDAFVINFDYDKKFPFNIPHTTVCPVSSDIKEDTKLIQYKGMKRLKEALKEKRNTYIKKMKKYPKTVAIDTVTGMYGMMTTYNDKKLTGFDIHKQNTAETEAFNVMLDELFCNHGINVVIVAHAMYDEGTGAYSIPASGSFAKRGSWISAVDHAVFMEVNKDAGEITVHHKTIGLPCRSLVEELPEEQTRDEFNLQEYLDLVVKSTSDAESLEI